MKRLKTKDNKKSNYTLIEIIVVFGIIALLLAVALPGFNDMMKGAGLEGGARNVCQILKLARSYGINNNERIAIIFPKDELSANYNRCAYRVCVVTDTNEFKKWFSGEKWQTLPKGIIIFAIKKTSKVTQSDTSFAGATTVTKVNCDDINESSSVNLPAIVFKPNGTLSGSDDQYIGISEGVSDGSNITKTNPNAQPANICISPFTGRITYMRD